jgi:hypothetical protein
MAMRVAASAARDGWTTLVRLLRAAEAHREGPKTGGPLGTAYSARFLDLPPTLTLALEFPPALFQEIWGQGNV